MSWARVTTGTAISDREEDTLTNQTTTTNSRTRWCRHWGQRCQPGCRHYHGERARKKLNRSQAQRPDYCGHREGDGETGTGGEIPFGGNRNDMQENTYRSN
jgi:hypothetical protein